MVVGVADRDGGPETLEGSATTRECPLEEVSDELDDPELSSSVVLPSPSAPLAPSVLLVSRLEPLWPAVSPTVLALSPSPASDGSEMRMDID